MILTTGWGRQDSAQLPKTSGLTMVYDRYNYIMDK